MSNFSPETAIEITALPYENTQSMNGATAPNYYVWYKYTTRPGEIVIGWWAHAPEASNLNPVTDIYLDPHALEEDPEHDFFETRGALQIPVQPETTYWFRVKHQNEGDPAPPFTADLTVSVLPAPDGDFPAGSILIPDDTYSVAAVLSATTGEVLGFRSFPPGENGEVLPSGAMLTEDGNETSIVKLYSADFELLQAIDLSDAQQISRISQISSNRHDRFYVAWAGFAGSVENGVAALSADGTEIDRWYFTDGSVGLTGGAASRDGTVFYFGGQGGSVNRPIKRWDLVNDVALSDFAPAIASTSSGDILVHEDESVLVEYNSAATSYVRRFARDGTFIQDYVIGADGIDHMAWDPDGASFWVWSQPFDATKHYVFYKIRVSDGTVLEQFNGVSAETGAIEPLDGQDYSTDDPAGRFGASFSCPLMITHAAIVAEVAEPPVDESVPSECVCPPAGETTTPGAAPPPNPFVPLPAWEAFCTGGGLVPQAPDVVNSEDWSL